MNATAQIVMVRVLAPALASLELHAGCRGGSGEAGREEVQLASGCIEIVDPWTPMTPEERVDACQKLLAEQAAELGGLSPRDCQVLQADAVDCDPALGTRLACRCFCAGGSSRERGRWEGV